MVGQNHGYIVLQYTMEYCTILVLYEREETWARIQW